MRIIVTGASSGIGFYTALALAESSTNQVLGIGRNPAGLADLEKKAKYNNVKTLSFDFENEDYSPLIQAIIDSFNLNANNQIDILINNAGYLSKNLFIDTSMHEWMKTFQVNLFSIPRIINGLYEFLNKTQGCHIVNIASMGGILGSRKFPGLSVYSASKAAVNSLTESLAVEFQGTNIHVNALSPGTVQTKMLENAFPGVKANLSSEDMGRYIANFALNSGKFMNGRLIQVSLES